MQSALRSLLLLALAIAPLRGQPALELAATPHREYYRDSSVNRVYLETRFGAAAGTGDAASVVNLALVLDRSGSMAGAPIQALRQAVAAAIGSLAERDVVALVQFGSEVTTLLEATRRDRIVDLDRLLAQMEPAGGAALYDALNQGAAQLRRYAAPGTINHLVLVTDGPPTKGPREADDFTRLAAVFAREGITLSTIGLGQEFNEDLLASLARIGSGQFRYVARPEKLIDALQAELAPRRALLAREAVLTVEFSTSCSAIASYGWQPAVIENRTVTFRFPYVFATAGLGVLIGTEVAPQRGLTHDLATVRLRWKEPTGDTMHEATRTVAIALTADTGFLNYGNPSVIRLAASAIVSDGMQQAIEQLDKGDFRRALRALRRARQDAHNLSYELADPATLAKIRQLDTYLAEVQARGLGQLDRKVLRSGLFNQFASPSSDDAKLD